MKQAFEPDVLVDFFLTRRVPPWRPIASRELASLLGVSLQSLANWRVRGSGPTQEPPRKGKGNRTFYRPIHVLSWLEQGRREPWEYSRDWLLRRGMDVAGGLDQSSTQWMIDGIDDML